MGARCAVAMASVASVASVACGAEAKSAGSGARSGEENGHRTDESVHLIQVVAETKPEYTKPGFGN